MSSFERKKLPNGKPNPKYVDLCDEDQPIAGQKFACMSFISPDKILKKRETFLFQHFVHQWDLTKSMEKFSDFLNFLSYLTRGNRLEIHCLFHMLFCPFPSVGCAATGDRPADRKGHR